MKERLQLMFLAFFFDGWGHWWGSRGLDALETFSHALGVALGLGLVLWITSLLDNRPPSGPEGWNIDGLHSQRPPRAHVGGSADGRVRSDRSATLLLLTTADQVAGAKVQRALTKSMRNALGERRGFGVVAW